MRELSTEDIILGLKHARGYIEQGWCQGSYRNYAYSTTRYCILGALLMAGADLAGVTIGNNQMETNGEERKLADIVRCQLTLHEGLNISLTTWNDRRGRHKKDVLDLLDRTIERVMKEGV